MIVLFPNEAKSFTFTESATFEPSFSVVKANCEDYSKIRNRELLKVILNAMAKHYGWEESYFTSLTRRNTVSWHRHISMYLCRSLTGLTYSEIAAAHGRKDHALVPYAMRKVTNEIDDCWEVRQEVAMAEEIAKVAIKKFNERGKK